MTAGAAAYANGVVIIPYRSSAAWYPPGATLDNPSHCGESHPYDGSGTNHWPCFQQPGRGSGANAWQGGNTSYSYPIYEWDNCNNATGGGCTGTENQVKTTVLSYCALEGCSAYTDYTASHVQPNRDYYDSVAAFTGAAGIGVGTLASRPSTCTKGVAYWATDVDNGNGGTNHLGVLYQCTVANTWSQYYKPYVYPHPLQQ
jgi:hypothetical protein